MYTHLYVLAYKSLQNPKILDNIKFYVMTYIHSCFNSFIDMFYRILSTDERGSSWRRLCRCRLHQTRVCRDDSLWCDRQRWSRCHDDNRFSVSLNACVIYLCTECIFYHIWCWVRNDLVKMIKQTNKKKKHYSYTVVTCAKFRCDRSSRSTYQTRALQILV